MFILRKIYAFFVDAIQSILIAASIFLVIYIFIARPFQVNGDSMSPNFINGEYVLTNLLALRISNPRLGDVVVFVAPIDAEKDFIKRVIGVPGDTVMVKDGDVYLNGKKLDQSKFLKPPVKTYGGSFLKDEQVITVPPDEYFVMGDNRTYSSDSREWGFVKRSALIGESAFVYWPPQSMRSIKNPFPSK
ncbi:MAG TPA: signal peptidase I [Candidatus Saccharimonadales bacterium]|nr:signal peptidase I [Candidatus Saccharimonadales bacterium]